jgi:radical SAM protein with 4Fe4S-binding SPASM domain
MIDLGRENQIEEWVKLKRYFKDFNVYIYLKSKDQLWIKKENKNNNSISWNEFCLFPWYAMTVKSDGNIACCSEDYNNDIILGNTKEQSLYDIWNGEKYKQFRWDHINNRQDFRCGTSCDMSMIGKYL